MKRITALCTFAVIILFSLMARISTCNAADSATPDAASTAEGCSDMMSTAAIAAQAAVAPNVNAGDRFLVIRIRIPENKVLLISIIATVILITSAVVFAKRHNGKAAEKPAGDAAGSNTKSYSETNSAVSTPKETTAPAVPDTDTASDDNGSTTAEENPTANSNPEPKQNAPKCAADEKSSTAVENINVGSTTSNNETATQRKEQIKAATQSDNDIAAQTPTRKKNNTPKAADKAAAGPMHTVQNTSADAAATTAAVIMPEEIATVTEDTAYDMPQTGTAPIAAPNEDVAHDVEETAHTDMSTSAGDRELGQRIEEFVAEHMHNVDLSVDDIAEAMCMSRSTLFRSMKRIYGVNPNEYLRQRRLSYAADLLQQNKYTISDICLLVGFNSPSYFSSCFKKQYNVLPKDYRGR